MIQEEPCAQILSCLSTELSLYLFCLHLASETAKTVKEEKKEERKKIKEKDFPIL